MSGSRLDHGRDRVLRSYRRFLVDMHVPDWDDEFMAHMDPDVLVGRVAGAGASMITLPANNHAGLNFFPSSVGAAHRGQGCSQLLPRCLDAAAANQLGTVVYYCLSYVDWFWHHFPDARVVDGRGEARRVSVPSSANAARFGVVCINSPRYREFARTQVEELAKWYDPDGYNLDMTFWPGVCFCLNCRLRTRTELGEDIPTTVDWGDDRWLAFMAARRRWMAEFVEGLAVLISATRPGSSITHQSGGYVNDWACGSSEQLSTTADWLSADLYQDRATLSVSLKLFEDMSRRRPAELIHSWASPTIFEHTATKSAAEIFAVGAAAVSNGAALSIIEAINPDGTTSPDRYERVKPLFGLLSELEPSLGGERQADVALYRSFAGNFDLAECGRDLRDILFIGEPGYQGPSPSSHRLATTAAANALIEGHILFGVATRLDLARLADWQALLLSNLGLLDADERDALVAYASGGGSLYVSASGAMTNKAGPALAFWCDLLGIEVVGRAVYPVTYMVPAPAGSDIFKSLGGQRPYTLHSDQLLVRDARGDGTPLAYVGLPYISPSSTRYASVLTDPMGRVTDHPALLEKRIGRGRVLLATGPMEAEAPEEQRAAFIAAVRSLLSRESITVGAPKCIEVTAFRREDQGATMLYFLNSQSLWPPVPVRDIPVTMRSGTGPLDVTLLPTNETLSWTFDEFGLHFVLPECQTLAVVKIQC